MLGSIPVSIFLNLLVSEINAKYNKIFSHNIKYSNYVINKIYWILLETKFFLFLIMKYL